jgi:hypothetical protein
MVEAEVGMRETCRKTSARGADGVGGSFSGEGESEQTRGRDPMCGFHAA